MTSALLIIGLLMLNGMSVIIIETITATIIPAKTTANTAVWMATASTSFMVAPLFLSRTMVAANHITTSTTNNNSSISQQTKTNTMIRPNNSTSTIETVYSINKNQSNDIISSNIIKFVNGSKIESSMPLSVSVSATLNEQPITKNSSTMFASAIATGSTANKTTDTSAKPITTLDMPSATSTLKSVGTKFEETIETPPHPLPTTTITQTTSFLHQPEVRNGNVLITSTPNSLTTFKHKEKNNLSSSSYSSSIAAIDAIVQKRINENKMLPPIKDNGKILLDGKENGTTARINFSKNKNKNNNKKNVTEVQTPSQASNNTNTQYSERTIVDDSKIGDTIVSKNILRNENDNINELITISISISTSAPKAANVSLAPTRAISVSNAAPATTEFDKIKYFQHIFVNNKTNIKPFDRIQPIELNNKSLNYFSNLTNNLKSYENQSKRANSFIIKANIENNSAINAPASMLEVKELSKIEINPTAVIPKIPSILNVVLLLHNSTAAPSIPISKINNDLVVANISHPAMVQPKDRKYVNYSNTNTYLNKSLGNEQLPFEMTNLTIHKFLRFDEVHKQNVATTDLNGNNSNLIGIIQPTEIFKTTPLSTSSPITKINFAKNKRSHNGKTMPDNLQLVKITEIPYTTDNVTNNKVNSLRTFENISNTKPVFQTKQLFDTITTETVSYVASDSSFVLAKEIANINSNANHLSTTTNRAIIESTIMTSAMNWPSSLSNEHVLNISTIDDNDDSGSNNANGDDHLSTPSNNEYYRSDISASAEFDDYINDKEFDISMMTEHNTKTISITSMPSQFNFNKNLNSYSADSNIMVNGNSSGVSVIVGDGITTVTTWPVKHAAVVEGDVILGGLMMVHSREDSITCGPIMPQGGIQALEVMLFTLDRINEIGFLPNISLGAHILDDCDKDTYGLEMAVDFIKGKCQKLFF